MPGHKRKALGDVEQNSQIDAVLDAVQAIDVTELPDTDDLHRPTGMIGQSLKELARVYETLASFYLVNGATCGILAGITACAKLSGKKHILVARNCHSSVYNAVQLLELTPVYLDPCFTPEGQPHFYGGITMHDVKDLLEGLPREVRGDLCCAVLTSPTYEGIISDIQRIANVVHGFHIPLLVDEAHGAHLPFAGKEAPVSSLYLGADITVQSLHKTMPAPTQTALLHVQSEALVEPVQKYVSVYMTSSPSYPMMLSMERAVALADENRADFSTFYENIAGLRERVRALNSIRLYDAADAVDAGAYDYDASRLVICAETAGKTRIPGSALLSLLQSEKIECEMAGPDYVVLIATVCDGAEDMRKLYSVLEDLDKRLSAGEAIPQQDADFAQDTEQLIAQAEAMLGKVAQQNIYAYPPGSYIVTVGETVTEKAVGEMKRLLRSGICLYGLNT